MNLSEALTMGRQVLDQERDSAASWRDRRMLLRTALQMVLDAIEDNNGSDGEDEEEPVPAEPVPVPAVVAWHPGDCTCGGHVDRVGVFHAAVTP